MKNLTEINASISFFEQHVFLYVSNLRQHYLNGNMIASLNFLYKQYYNQTFHQGFFIVAQMKMKGHSGHTCNPLNHVCNTQNNVVVTYILNVKILQFGYCTSVLRILQLM